MLALLCLVVVALGGGGRAAGATGKPTLVLLAPPATAGPASAYTLRLAVTGGGAETALSLDVAVYQCLGNPTDFDETLTGSPSEPVLAEHSGIAWSSLPSDPGDPTTGVDLTVPLRVGTVTGPGAGPFTAALRCASGAAGGVYPVQLRLVEGGGAVAARLLTYLVYTDPAADTVPLRFALVAPLVLAPSASGAPAAVTTAGLGHLTAVVDALSGSGVPVTVAPGPATVAAIAADRGSRARATLAGLVQLSADPVHETVCGPYVAVGAGTLVSPALGGSTELDDQVRRGLAVLGTVAGLRTTDCPASAAWVGDATVTTAAAGALDALGYHDLVVPPSAVAGPGPSNTPSRLFTVVGAPATTRAVLSDPGLSGRLRGEGGDPALAADQVLAELALDYYEAPNTAEPRGVVAVAPGQVDPAVVSEVLGGLVDNPMVEPVTLATLFGQVPVGGQVGTFTQPSPRRLVGAGRSNLPTAAISAARARWSGFSAAVDGTAAGTAVAGGLDDLLLSAEASGLGSGARRDAVARFDTALQAQLSLVSITSRAVRLTARTGSVPVTVVKTAPYPVEAVLTVTSDKIAFTGGTGVVPNSECHPATVTTVAGRSTVSALCTFVHGTNAVYIQMRSRVSGDFRMTVTLDSPQAGLVMASGQLTVRSMSTSAVAIALSVAAGLVLLGWWGRTMGRTRRERRAARRHVAVP